MPAGASTIDANGVRLYGEDDLIAALWSDFMNLGIVSISDALTALKGRVTTTESRLNNPPTFIAVDGAARDTQWGTPTTASARRALQDKGAATTRLDLGWTERYYANLTDGGANTGGATVAGWYPITGKLPFVSLGMAAISPAIPTGFSTVGMGWDTELSDVSDLHNSTTNPSRVTIKQAGQYQVTVHLTGTSASGAAYAGVQLSLNGAAYPRATKTEGTSNGVVYPSPVIAQVVTLAAGDYLEVNGQVSSGASLTVAGSLFQLRYLGPS